MGNSKYDTYSTTVWKMVRVMDTKVFGEGADRSVIVTFCDSSKAKDTLDLWIDAYVEGNPDYTMHYQKGDTVCVTGKLRVKLDNKGNPRGRVYDAIVESFAPLKERMIAAAPVTPTTITDPTPVAEAFDTSDMAPAFE